MSLTIVPRSAIGVPDPGTRQKLAPGLRTLLVHYTGVSGYTDPSKDLEYAKKIAAYGAAAGKTYEYNFIVGLGGTVFEQAGDRIAAHCKGYNAQSIGVLMMLGVGVEPTRAQIDSFRQLRAWLVEAGALSADHEVGPHYRYRATSCPGLTLADRPGARWPSPTGEGSQGELIDELLEPWIEPQQIATEGDEMLRYKDTRYANEFLLPSGLTYAGEVAAADRAHGGVADVPLIQGTNDPVLEAYCRTNWGVGMAEAISRGYLVAA